MRLIETCSILAAAAAAVGVLAPVWVQAQGSREQAEKAACASNLKQLSTGMLMYVQDYDEHYPPASKWSTVVHPYVKNRRVYQCPTDGTPWSYGFNRTLSGASMSQVTQPASICLFFESNLHKANANGLAGDAVTNRHMGSSNWAYTDGHVKEGSGIPAFGPIAKPKAQPARKR